MKSDNELISAPIGKTLFRLAMPIMGAAFVLMAYNLYDMWTVGDLGQDALAAVGTAGFYTMLSMVLAMLTRIGAEVHIAQHLGRRQTEEAKKYAAAALQLAIGLSIGFTVIVLVARQPLIAIFNLNNLTVIDLAEKYLAVVALSIPFNISVNVLTGIFNSGGLASVPFRATFIGLIGKVILNLLFVNYLNLGVVGAALGTVLAQAITLLILAIYKRRATESYLTFQLSQRHERSYYHRVVRLGFPAGLQNFVFTLIAMVIGRLVAQFGTEAVAVQRLGAMIESVSWMTASGFATALSAVIAQNYGAKQYQRLVRGFGIGTVMVTMIGLFSTVLLIALPRQLFTIFLAGPEETVQLGINYLVILGVSQLFQSLEISTNGAFNGLGLTRYPSIIGIIFQSLRIPAALILMNTSLGLNGIWWSISLSTVLKGVVGISLFYWFVIRRFRHLPDGVEVY